MTWAGRLAGCRRSGPVVAEGTWGSDMDWPRRVTWYLRAFGWAGDLLLYRTTRLRETIGPAKRRLRCVVNTQLQVSPSSQCITTVSPTPVYSLVAFRSQGLHTHPQMAVQRLAAYLSEKLVEGWTRPVHRQVAYLVKIVLQAFERKRVHSVAQIVSNPTAPMPA